jgi:hypothetical protein
MAPWPNRCEKLDTSTVDDRQHHRYSSALVGLFPLAATIIITFNSNSPKFHEFSHSLVTNTDHIALFTFGTFYHCIILENTLQHCHLLKKNSSV